MKEFVWRSVLSAVLLAGFATEAEDILLKVTDAQLAGENIRVDDGLKISHWQFGETATWEFEIARPQRMNVIISYATPKGTRGFAIVDGNTLPRAPLYETEGWDQFKEASMGFIDLAPGNHSITIKPGNRVGGFVQLNQLRISTEQLIAQRV